MPPLSTQSPSCMHRPRAVHHVVMHHRFVYLRPPRAIAGTTAPHYLPLSPPGPWRSTTSLSFFFPLAWAHRSSSRARAPPSRGLQPFLFHLSAAFISSLSYLSNTTLLLPRSELGGCRRLASPLYPSETRARPRPSLHSPSAPLSSPSHLRPYPSL
jgi:hypothetical protein